MAWLVPLLLMLSCVALGLLGSLFVSGGDNLLDSLPTDHVVTVARYCVCVAIVFGVPYNTYMPRVAVTMIIKGFVGT